MMRSERRSLKIRTAVVALVATAVAGCATKGDIRSLQDELHALAASQDSLITQLRRETLSTQDTLRTQSDQIFDFRGDIGRQLQQIAQVLARLEALTGENQRGIVGLRDQVANLRSGGQATAGPSAGGTAPTAATGGGGAEQVVGTGGGNAEQLWGVAREQHQRGSFGTAQRAYRQFLQDYPSHALAPDAHFFLADILVQQDRPQDAIDAFSEIQRLYPTATRVPDALYRVAILQRQLGNNNEARATLQRIINTYPDAPMAMLARDLLEEIR